MGGAVSSVVELVVDAVDDTVEIVEDAVLRPASPPIS